MAGDKTNKLSIFIQDINQYSVVGHISKRNCRKDNVAKAFVSTLFSTQSYISLILQLVSTVGPYNNFI